MTSSKKPTVSCVSTLLRRPPAYIAEQATHIFTLLQNLSNTRGPYLSLSYPPISRYVSAVGLSAAPLTDTQRDTLDAEIKATIQQILILISRLEQAEGIRMQAAMQKLVKKYSTFRALLTTDDSVRQVEEAQLKLLSEHRDAVIWWLKNRLEEATAEQTERQNIRLERQRELSRSVLHKVKLPVWGVIEDTVGPIEKAAENNTEAIPIDELGEGLTQELVKSFEQENEGMVRQYQGMLDQVRTAEASLVEMGELQNRIFQTLSMQNSHLESLVQDSIETEQEMRRGNEQLRKVAEKTSIARGTFFAVAAFSMAVVVWDWFI